MEFDAWDATRGRPPHHRHTVRPEYSGPPSVTELLRCVGTESLVCRSTIPALRESNQYDVGFATPSVVLIHDSTTIANDHDLRWALDGIRSHFSKASAVLKSLHTLTCALQERGNDILFFTLDAVQEAVTAPSREHAKYSSHVCVFGAADSTQIHGTYKK